MISNCHQDHPLPLLHRPLKVSRPARDLSFTFHQTPSHQDSAASASPLSHPSPCGITRQFFLPWDLRTGTFPPFSTRHLRSDLSAARFPPPSSPTAPPPPPPKPYTATLWPPPYQSSASHTQPPRPVAKARPNREQASDTIFMLQARRTSSLG